MTADAPLENLYDHAHATRVAVIGGGISGLVAAREFAKLGMSVTVLEASGRLGGAIRTGEVDGLTLDRSDPARLVIAVVVTAKDGTRREIAYRYPR